MAVSILVVTPTAGFGQLIVQILEDSNGFTLLHAETAKQAYEITVEKQPSICVLDADLIDAPLGDLTKSMRKASKELLFILIPSEDVIHDEEQIEAIQAESVLKKPFYLPDLVSEVENLVHGHNLEDREEPVLEEAVLEESAPVPAAPREDDPNSPEWIKDQSEAKQQLSRLSIDTPSQASMITRGSEVWAFAGKLHSESANELVMALAHYFDIEDAGDLARFIHLESTDEEYMMYAISLGGEYVITMVFESEMPFSKIRSQVENLAQALSGDTPGELIIEDEEDSGLVDIEIDDTSQPQPLWEDVPPPIPSDWQPADLPSADRKNFLEELIDEPATIAEPLGVPVNSLQGEAQTKISEPHAPRIEPSLVPDYQAETKVSHIPDSDNLAETVPSSGLGHEYQDELKGPRELILESISPSMVNLIYTCVLLPRLPVHYLTGGIATSTSNWISQLCLAFGWRLEHLSIRPDHVLWMVNVPPDTSPGYLMGIIRQHTSRRLFVEYGRLEDENPSGDFWAPGYLIVSGNNPPPPALVKDFIQNTRKRQGLT